MAKEIWVVPFFGQGHLFPCMELCKQLASRDFNTLLVIPSNLSSSVPASLRQYPHVEIAEIPSSTSDPPLPGGSDDPAHHHHWHHNNMGLGLEKLLDARTMGPDGVRPVCAVVDVMMDWTAEVFQKFEVPMVGFFTSGACSAAVEYARWKAHPIDVKPGEVLLLPGLPEEMGLTYLDTKQQHHRPPGHRATHVGVGQQGPGPFTVSDQANPPPPFHGPRAQRMGPWKPGDRPHLEQQGPGPFDGPRLDLGVGQQGLGPFTGSDQSNPPPPPFHGPRPQGMGPRKPGHQPLWLDGIKQSIALMINTCDGLEHPFNEYLASQIGKPVWGTGPLLPEQYWKSVGSVVQDHKIRNNRQSNVTEDEVIQWLDSKPRGSVLYVSFGSEVGPSMEDYPQLADALEASTRPFIWVIQPGSGWSGPRMPPGSDSVEEGYFPHGLDNRVGRRGLIVHGWAPQLLILSHPSTGGFLSHCGWNSTVEAIGRGVPFLVWPIRGDQYNNAKLVVAHLKVGYMVSNDFTEKIEKDNIVQGIERLMDDGEVKQRAIALAAKFENGFPISSSAALDAFRDFVYVGAA